MRRTWAEYKRQERLRTKLQQQLQEHAEREQKSAQYQVDLGALLRDISSFNEEYKVRSKLVADLIELGETGSGSASLPVLLQHDRAIHEHQRNLNDHITSGGHVSAEEHAALQVRVDELEAAFSDASEIIDKMYRKLYGRTPGEESNG